MKKITALILCLILVLSAGLTFTGCNKAEDPNTFSFLLSASVDQTYYGDYNQNPAVLYAMQREYAGTKISFDFKNLLAGSEKEQLMTMFSTGEYYDVMAANYSDYSPEALYDMGVALDLTDYIDKYMPNYKAWSTSNTAIEKICYYVKDGEKRAYCIWSGADRPQNNFEGYEYRRDWIVKYGVNPSTGEKFTHWTDENGLWEDDVKFPSWYDENNKYAVEYKANHPDWDGGDPVFISDWEWMFGIFDKAREDLNITDGYNISIYYAGFMQTGDLFSSFGGGCPMFGYDYENNTVTFGATGESMKSYLECMRSWYEKGWLDKTFDQHSSDMFYSIDNAKVRSGKIGMWQGRRSELCDYIENATDYPATAGIYVFGARMPINDVYGAEETKGHEPDALYTYDYTTTPFIITTNAESKNLEALLTFIDSCYNYDDENIVSFTLGLNKEQYESIYDLQEKKDGKAIQEIYGLTEGNYTIEDRNGQKTYVMSDILKNDTYLRQASRVDGMPKMQIEKECDLTSRDMYDAIVNNWCYYENKSNIGQALLGRLSADDSAAFSKVRNNINTKMSVEIPKFIKGTYDLDGDFETYVKTLNKLGPQKAIDVLNKLYE